MCLTKPLTVKYDPQHDGRANQCRDRVDRQVAFEGGQACDEVAKQGQVHAKEGRSWDKQFVVAAAEEESCDMRNRQAQEGDRTTEGRDDGRQEARHQDDEHAAPTNIDAEVLGITLTEEQEV